MKAREIALFAIFTALIFVFGLFPYVFLIPLIVGSIMLGVKNSFFLSLIFGVMSLIYAYSSPNPVGIIFFQFPWIPILGRLPVGPLCALVYKAMYKKNAIAAVVLASITASLTNTVVVVTMMWAAAGDIIVAGYPFYVLVPMILMSASAEVLIAALAIFPLMRGIDSALNTYYARTRKQKLQP